MQIPPVQLEKLKAIYKQEFGVEFSDQEAQEEGTKILILMKAIYKPIPKEDLLKVEKSRQEIKEKLEKSERKRQ